MGRVRRFLIKLSAYIAGFVWAFSACAIDSEYNTPFFIGILVTSAYLGLLGYANGWFLREEC